MADIRTKSQRSANMAKIKGKNTKPELAVRKYLSKCGIRYRCNVSSLPGRPDIAIKKYKWAVRVNGCFWHSHLGCKDFRLPKSNIDFWTEKLGSNVERDKINDIKLEDLGFQVFTIWECDIKSGDYSELDRAIRTLGEHK